ncbi:SNF2 family N-terminal domain-containing protein [Lipomyces oligophaga]|uniref:SNF2 family N-terminal domain-containing protein n=1 Tax=Lipomyces oligophaga TaxID=45792 RepID=UPI0034CFE78E
MIQSPESAMETSYSSESSASVVSRPASSPPSSPLSDSEPISKEQFDFNGLENDKKLARLRFLIDRSTVYASILSDRLAQQQQEKERALEAEAKKAHEPKVGRKNQEPSSNRKTTKSRHTRANTKHATYSIADYITKDEIKQNSKKSTSSEDPPPSTSHGQPSLVTGGILKDYQLAGVEWLISLYENGLNGILADEMGLGKTLQTISFLAFLREKGSFGPFLVVAPLSTLDNWVNEFSRFTPSIPTVLYHGSPDVRRAIRSSQLSKKVDHKFPIVITSYQIILQDAAFLRSISWKFIIIDEGHRIKNMNCRLIKELKSFDSANRLLLTGTPLQNNLAELWSLLNFLLPDIFHDLELFQSWFDFSALNRENGTQEILDSETKNQLVSNLHAILKPFLLRRVKSDVDLDLPPKREYVLYAPLTRSQESLYRNLLSGDVKEFLVSKILEARAGSRPKKRRRTAKQSNIGSKQTARRAVKAAQGKYAEFDDDKYFDNLLTSPDKLMDELVPSDDEQEIASANKLIVNKKLQNLVMQLRLACDSPLLFYAPWDDPESGVTVPDESIVSDSGKMLLLDRLLPPLFAGDHKVLIFSQFTKMLDIIQDYAELLRGWTVCRFDGGVSQDERKNQIAKFNERSNCRLFLLSTRAGGLGINLTSADTVILFDSDWNPQQDLQAMDRAHRIGQTRPVLVFRFATTNTVEQAILDKAGSKRQLEKLVIQRGKFKSLLASAGGDTEKDEDLRRLLLGGGRSGSGDNVDDEQVKFVVKQRGDTILSDAELAVLLDRSPEAYEKADSAGAESAAFKVVDTAKWVKSSLL